MSKRAGEKHEIFVRQLDIILYKLYKNKVMIQLAESLRDTRFKRRMEFLWRISELHQREILRF